MRKMGIDEEENMEDLLDADITQDTPSDRMRPQYKKIDMRTQQDKQQDGTQLQRLHCSEGREGRNKDNRIL